MDTAYDNDIACEPEEIHLLFLMLAELTHLKK